MVVEERPSESAALENVDLLTLVEHREFVQATETTESVYKWFQSHQHEYVGVVSDHRLIGVVSRGHIGFLLGARFGFALYGHQTVDQHLMKGYLRIHRGSSLLTVLDQALSRRGDSFYDDVALTDAGEQFLGIITVPTLVQWQSRLILQKTQLTERQRQALQENNQQLFRSLNQLRQSQGRFEILFENSALGVALMNTRGEVETGNHRLEILLGSPINETGHAFDLSALVAPLERDNFLRLLQEHEADPQESNPRNNEFLLHLPGRGPRRFKFFTSWIRETGQVCALLDDITEQRVLEHRLIQKEKSAMLDSLVGGIAHEINNKLAPIIGFSELLLGQLERGQSPERLARYCSMIRESAMDSAKIIRQLLQLSRPVTAEMVACDLRELVREVVAFLGFRIRESGCEVVLDLPEDKIFIRADVTQVKQVIINLTLNALDALDTGQKKQLRFNVTEQNDRVMLKVSDSGHGIRPENLQHIFDPFFTTKDPDRGSGLGLSVCLSIIKQHGGEITAKSVLNEGSEFEIVLPKASEADVRLRSTKIPSPRADHGSGENGCAMGRRRVLVVDDEEYITSMIQEVLRSEMNCTVERVTNGLRAVTRLQRADFDFVISDVRMPELDGFGLYEWLKKNRPRLAENFLFITGDAGSQDLNQKLESLGARVLRKPFTLEKLVRECQRFLAASNDDTAATAA
ncbi:MAG TPA: ATP-binding protein [Candidatus Acidoferrum sp.]|jgi:signal transduction histidine kinase|nr:ATP-binding protein [Candidatus Acidoferrum sp.]